MNEPDKPTARAFPEDPARTAEVIAALRWVAEFAERHALPLTMVDAKRGWPSSRRFDGSPVLPKVTVQVPGSRVMARWCRAIGATRVRVERRPGTDTCMWADADVDGITVEPWGSYDLVLGARDDVTWSRKANGRLGVWGEMTVDAVEALPEADYEHAATKAVAS